MTGDQKEECEEYSLKTLTLDSLSSDVQARIASKMFTSDLARMRVTLEAPTHSSIPHLFVYHMKYCLEMLLSPDSCLQAVSKSWKTTADILEVGSDIS